MSFDFFPIPLFNNLATNLRGAKDSATLLPKGIENNAFTLQRFEAASGGMPFYELLLLGQHKLVFQSKESPMANPIASLGKGEDGGCDKELGNLSSFDLLEGNLGIQSPLKDEDPNLTLWGKGAVCKNGCNKHILEHALDVSTSLAQVMPMGLDKGREIVSPTLDTPDSDKKDVIGPPDSKSNTRNQNTNEKEETFSPKQLGDTPAVTLWKGPKFFGQGIEIEKQLFQLAIKPEDISEDRLFGGDNIDKLDQSTYSAPAATNINEPPKLHEIRPLSENIGKLNPQQTVDPWETNLSQNNQAFEKNASIHNALFKHTDGVKDENLSNSFLWSREINPNKTHDKANGYEDQNIHADKSGQTLVEKITSLDPKKQENIVDLGDKTQNFKLFTTDGSTPFVDSKQSYDPAPKERGLEIPHKMGRFDSSILTHKGDEAYQNDSSLESQKEDFGGSFNFAGDQDFETGSKGQRVSNSREFALNKSEIDFPRQEEGMKDVQSLDPTEMFSLNPAKEKEVLHVASDSKRLMETIAKSIELNKGARSVIRVTIYPEELGEVEVRVAGEKERLTVKIVAMEPDTKDLIEMDLSSLKEKLLAVGYEVQEIMVDGGEGEGASYRQDLPKGWARSARVSREEKDPELVIAPPPSSLSNISLFA